MTSQTSNPTSEGTTAGLGFADQAFRGRNGWWRYLLALVLILGGIFLLTFVLSWLYQEMGLYEALRLSLGGPDAVFAPLADRVLGFVFLMSSLVLTLPLMRLVLPWLHKRPWRSFLTAKPRFDMRLALRSVLVMIILRTVFFNLGTAFGPESVSWTGEWVSVLIFAPVALVLFPLQSLAEEIFFRGYLAQLTGRLSPRFLTRLVVPAIIFAGAHFSNPESHQDPIWVGANYLLLALYLGFLSLRGQGLEASFGAHLGSNLFGGLILGSSVSVSPGPTLWSEGLPDFRLSLVPTVILLALHYIFVFVFRGPSISRSNG